MEDLVLKIIPEAKQLCDLRQPPPLLTSARLCVTINPHLLQELEKAIKNNSVKASPTYKRQFPP